MSNHLTTTITTTFGLSQLIIPSSFVAKTSGITLKTSQGNVTLAQFRLGRGGWIIQAKANIVAVGGTFGPNAPLQELQQPVSVRWTLVAEAPLSGEDTAVVDTLLHATIVVMFGVQVSTTAVVDLVAKNQGGGIPDVSALIENIVITGIKQDEVITLAM